MKALLTVLIISGLLAANESQAQAQAEPSQIQGPLPDRQGTEAGSAECESGTCNTQHNSDDLTENAQQASLQAKGTLMTGKKPTSGSGSEVTQ